MTDPVKRTKYQLRVPPTRRPQRGMTVVELMVAITLAVFLAGVLAALFIASNRSRQELDRTSNQIENGRYVMDILGEEIRHAGFFGSTGVKRSTALTEPPAPCSDSEGDIVGGLAYPIARHSLFPASCGDPRYTHVSGTPILVVRRASTAVISAANAATEQNAEKYFVQSIPSDSPRVDLGSAGFDLKYDDGTVAPIRPLLIKVFWIGVGADGNSRLLVTEYGIADGASFTTNVVAEGVENVQYVFGLDTDGADGVVDVMTDSPTPAQVRDDLITVRVDLLVRNSAATTGYVDSATYNLGLNVTYTPTGNAASFKRNLFSSEFRVNNALAPRIYCPNASVCL